MAKKNSNIQINFVTATDVRRYAQDELLPLAQREAIEQALLDDERARQLVGDVAADRLELPCPKAERRLAAAEKACAFSLCAYQRLRDRAACPETIRIFAESRIGARAALCQSIASTTTGATDALASRERGAQPPDSEGVDAAIEAATTRDDELLCALIHAYLSPSNPILKAKIAGWIAGIENDNNRVAWLDSALKS